jgi:E3 ubiquitin-protein ligase MYCBP2
MSKHVVYTACNNGSSGILTKEGEVYIFGKDTTHCDHATGTFLGFETRLNRTLNKMKILYKPN